MNGILLNESSFLTSFILHPSRLTAYNNERP